MIIEEFVLRGKIAAKMSGKIVPAIIHALNTEAKTIKHHDVLKCGIGTADLGMRSTCIKRHVVVVSHPILQGKPNASHMCSRINLHTHDRQNESNTIAVIKRSRVKPVRYPLLHPERWTRRSEHNDN
jgi:hypothetical protein